MSEQTDAQFVAGDVMSLSLAEFKRRCVVRIQEELARTNPNNAAIALWCEAVRLARENERLGKLPVLLAAPSTNGPSDTTSGEAERRTFLIGGRMTERETNQPSDETFLDEMAETLRAVESDNGVYPALVVSVPDFLRLVALARRAPALTPDPRVDELRSALRVIRKAVRGDEKGECWTIRHWLNKRQVFNDDLGSVERLVLAACEHALKPDAVTLHAPAPPEARP